jgi:dGTPase
MMSDEPFKNPLNEDEYSKRLLSRKEDVRGPYFRDQTEIIHSLPFRRLKHKAQVFFSPNNDHVCTRIEHALHVATIAATIAKGLNLNETMVYAIGLAHDLGHAPFGHAGESVLNQKSKDIGRFIHEIHSLRVVDKLGNRGRSLNLTYGVRDGIVCHCGEKLDQQIYPRNDKLDLAKIKDKTILPSSYEGCVARIADRIAYLGRDLDDAIYGHFINKEEVPQKILTELGGTNAKIIDCLVLDVITTSKKKGIVALSDEKYEVLLELHKFSEDHIYNHAAIKRYKLYCERIIETLFDYLINIYNTYNSRLEEYRKSPVQLDVRFGSYLRHMKSLYDNEKTPAKSIVRDYIAGMTDSYALKCMREISLPEELNFDKSNRTQLQIICAFTLRRLRRLGRRHTSFTAAENVENVELCKNSSLFEKKTIYSL